MYVYSSSVYVIYHNIDLYMYTYIVVLGRCVILRLESLEDTVHSKVHVLCCRRWFQDVDVFQKNFRNCS